MAALAGSETFSFLGVDFQANIVSRVRITNGNVALGPNDAPPTTDVVAMDDFIYGEPNGPTAATFVSFSGRHTPRGVVLRWRTAQEVGSLGFNVYRGSVGHRVRLNRAIVRAKGSVAGAGYAYRDVRAPRHARLRVLARGGRHRRLAPVARAAGRLGRVAQKCEVTPAGSSSAVLRFLDGLRLLVPRVGVLAVVEILRELRQPQRMEGVAHDRQLVRLGHPDRLLRQARAAGRAGSRTGWSVTDPTSIPFREPNWPST